jgi:hypothetical protein
MRDEGEQHGKDRAERAVAHESLCGGTG